MEAGTIDSTATEMAPEEEPSLAAPSEDAPAGATELVLAQAGAGAMIAADTPEEILSKASQIATPLKQLIESAGLSKNLGGQRKHVEVGGWQAAGTMLGALGGQALHAETEWTRKTDRVQYSAKVTRYFKKDQGGGVRETVTYDVDGYSWEARVAVKTAAGVVLGVAEAQCGRDEETWNDRSDYAVRSMAETRAESRAYRRAIGWIMHLAGYNPTPAEEMGHAPGDVQVQAEIPSWAREATVERKKLAHASLAFLFDDAARATEVLKEVRETLGAPMAEMCAVLLSKAAGSQQRAHKMAEAAREQKRAGQDADAEAPQEEPTGTFDPTKGAIVEDEPTPRPPAGSVDPELDVEMTAEQQEARLRERGCICETPLGAVKFADDSCPIKGHGIPF